jgi:hypothetical protein
MRLGEGVYIGIRSMANFFPLGKPFIIPGEIYNYSVPGSSYIEL